MLERLKLLLGWDGLTEPEIIAAQAQKAARAQLERAEINAPRRHAMEARIKQRWAEIEVALKIERETLEPVLQFRRKA